MQQILTRSFIGGLVTLGVGIIATLLVDLIIPTPNLTWSLYAVGWASFFAGFAGYAFGWRQHAQER